MNASDEYEKCRECGEILKTDGPCPHCQSTERVRVKPAECAIATTSGLRAKGALVIGWQEVDRLFAEKEYAAALLVAAVNVEFILWENLQRFSKTANPSIQDNRVGSMWGQITSNHPEKLTLSSLRKVAEYMSQQHGLVLAGSWESVVGDIEGVRNSIGHERGCFAELTQLKDPDWPETRIRKILEDAKVFCHGNG